MSPMLRSIGCACAFAMVLAASSVSAADPDFEQREFRSTWRKKGTNNRISFNRIKQSFAVEFDDPFWSKYNTTDGTFSRCDRGRDGGANLCVSGRLFDCAFLYTVSQGNVVHLALRRSGMGDPFCREMQGDYVVLIRE